MVGSFTDTIVSVSSETGLTRTPLAVHFSGALNGAGAATAGDEAGIVCAKAAVAIACSTTIGAMTSETNDFVIAESSSFEADPVQFNVAFLRQRYHKVVHADRRVRQFRVGEVPFRTLWNLDPRNNLAVKFVSTDFDRR